MTVIVGVLAAGALLWTRPSPPDSMAARAQTQGAPPRTLHTTGTAVIRLRPDKATVRLGVQTFASAPRESQAKNARIVERVLQAIRDQGVPAQDISTSHFALRPEQDYKQAGEGKIVGYWTDNAVVVTLREVDQLSDVLTAALEAGATTVDDLTFTTTRLRELRDEARSLAVKAAMEKAHALAGTADVTVGEVQTIGENSWASYYGLWNSRGSLAKMQQNVLQVASAPGAPVLDDGEFSLGQMVVQAQVDLTVTLK
jgi:hypothetical protein